MSRLIVDSDQILEQPVETDAQVEPTTTAEVVFKGRNVEIPDHFDQIFICSFFRLSRNTGSLIEFTFWHKILFSEN